MLMIQITSSHSESFLSSTQFQFENYLFGFILIFAWFWYKFWWEKKNFKSI